MEMEWEARPVSIAAHWASPSQPGAGPSTAPAPATAPSSAFRALSQRRRVSSALHGPPATSPPAHPIPNVPLVSVSVSDDDGDDDDEKDAVAASLPAYDPYRGYDYSAHSSRGASPSYSPLAPASPPLHSADTSLVRPSASAGLAAVAAFGQARTTAAPAYALTPSASSEHLPRSPPPHLGDSPPRSILRPAPARSPQPQPNGSTTPTTTTTTTGEIMPNRLLLSPPETHPGSGGGARPSSRRTLTRALELAREAVKLDSTNDDPHGAIVAYGRSVALLKEVMERVRRGEDSSEGRRRNGRRRSVVAQEEEIRRLKSIVSGCRTSFLGKCS
jgi:hypothetical protein